MSVRKGIWYKLTPEYMAHAAEVGIKRHAAAVARGGRHGNNLARNFEADQRRDIDAARCELAAHLALGTRHWNAFDVMTGEKEADLDGWIDVKERRQLGHRLIVQKDDPADWGYVSVMSRDAPNYLIDFWCYGHEAQSMPTKELQPGRPAHCVLSNDDIVRGVDELKEQVAVRRIGLNPCEVCAAPAPFGFDAYRKPGKWYCGAHVQRRAQQEGRQ